VDAAAPRSYIAGMYRLIRRRVVALALAYVLALNSVLPLLPAFAAGVGEICATDDAGTRSGADLPDRHGPVCPFGTACAAPGWDTTGLPVFVVAVAFVSRPDLFLVCPDDEARVLHDVGRPFARAPPLA
jgi:hypothetical protein